MKFAQLAVLLTVAASLSTPLAAAPFRDGIVVFGDSLSETGFFDSVTGGAVPGPGYDAGRFSNGPVWIEHVAEALGHTAPLPPTRGGTNYAFGAARTHTDLAPDDEAGLVHMDRQVGMYLDQLGEHPAQPPRHDLFVLWGGANDIMRADPEQPIDAVASARNIGRYIEQLYDAGGRNFLVGDLPMLGNVPATVGNEDVRDALNAITSVFNNELAHVLAELEQELALNLFHLPAAELFDEAWASEHGFANVDEPAVPGLEPGATEWGEPVANPEDYMFWDAIHPSAEMHKLIADAALDGLEGLGPPGWYHQQQLSHRFTSIPEPASAALVAGAALLLLGRRHRRASDRLA